MRQADTPEQQRKGSRRELGPQPAPRTLGKSLAAPLLLNAEQEARRAQADRMGCGVELVWRILFWSINSPQQAAQDRYRRQPRVDDVEIRLPCPLLWRHQTGSPVGEVLAALPSRARHQNQVAHRENRGQQFRV